MTLNKVLLYTLANFERGKGRCCAWSFELSEPASTIVASVLSATKTCEDTLALRTDMMIKLMQVLGNDQMSSLARHLHDIRKHKTSRKFIRSRNADWIDQVCLGRYPRVLYTSTDGGQVIAHGQAKRSVRESTGSVAWHTPRCDIGMQNARGRILSML